MLRVYSLRPRRPRHNHWSFVKHILGAPKSAKVTPAIVVLAKLQDQAETRSIETIFARVLGCYVTTAKWLGRARETRTAPQGWAYRGILQRRVHFGLSPGVSAQFPQLHDLLRVLSHKVKGIEYTPHVEGGQTAVASLKDAYEADARTAGLNGKTWSRVCFLCRDGADKADQVARHGLTEPAKRMCQTLNEYLTFASKAVANPVCPGNWGG